MAKLAVVESTIRSIDVYSAGFREKLGSTLSGANIHIFTTQHHLTPGVLDLFYDLLLCVIDCVGIDYFDEELEVFYGAVSDLKSASPDLLDLSAPYLAENMSVFLLAREDMER